MPRRLSSRVLLCIVLAISLFSTLAAPSTSVRSAQATAQPDLGSAPRLIDVYPPSGVQVGPREPLVVTFDQPMDQASVEAAIDITPQVIGAFSWQDAQTVTFTPSENWPRATAITLQIAKGARTQRGAALENTSTYTFSAMPSLQVSSITPSSDTAVSASQTRIIVAFDRPIIPLTTAEETTAQPAPLRIDPPISGAGEWVNTSVYTFTPSAPLSGGSSYTITVPAGLAAADGSTLEKTVTSTFSVALAQVKSISAQSDALECRSKGDNTPVEVGLNCPISLTFTEPMDHAATEAAFSLTLNGVSISGRFAWASDDQSVIFTPVPRLQPDSTYTVRVSTSAQTKAHTEIAVSQPLMFKTVPLPRIASSGPENGETAVDPGGGISLEFSTLMRYSTLVAHVQILPLPPGLSIDGSNPYEPYGTVPSDQIGELRLNFTSQPETTYTITLTAGAEDIYGYRTTRDQTITFTTGKVRPIPPIAYPILNGSLVTARDTDKTVHFDMLVRGKLDVPITLYPLSTEAFNVSLANFQFGEGYCRGADGTFGYKDRSLLDTAKLTPLRTWTQHFDEPSDTLSRRSVALTESGQLLPPGLYLVQAGPYQFVLSAATANITVKRSKGELFAWVTDVATAKPLPNVPVILYVNKSAFIPQNPDASPVVNAGTTDANGIVRVDLTQIPAAIATPIGENVPQIYVVAQSNALYGAWYSCLDYLADYVPERKAYLYTDRPIYRPGETVYVKGIVREQHDMTFTPLAKKIAHLTLSLDQGYPPQTLAVQDVSIMPAGSFTAQFKLSDTVAVGSASITLSFPDDDETAQYRNLYGYSRDYYGGITPTVDFQIAAFRPPDFAVNVNAAQSQMIQGDPLAFDVAANYYSGGVVSSASLNWTLYSAPAYFDFRGKGTYTFDDERWPYFYNDKQDTGTATTSANGGQHIVSTNTLLSDQLQQLGDGLGPGTYRTSYTTDPAPGKRPVLYIPEATLTDQAANPVSARAPGVIAHPANVYVGIDATRWGAPSGQPLSIKLIAVRPDSTPLAGQTLKVMITKITWKRSLGKSMITDGLNDANNPQWYEAIDPITSESVITTADGTALDQFTPSEPGVYRVAVQTTDAQGRVNSATLRLYISGGAETLWNDPLLAMQPVADKHSYRPGEKALLQVPLGFTGHSRVLVTVERSGVITSDVVEADGPLLTYMLPITDAYAPGAFVSFTAYHGIDTTHPEPDYRYGSVRIAVEPLAKRLTVTLTPTSAQTVPGGSATFNVHVADLQGRPVSAEVGLALVDKSVLALVEPNTPTLEGAFYNPDVFNYVTTDLSMFGYLPLLTDSYIVPCCFGGGGGGPFRLGGQPGYVRDNYKFTALWSPFVTTDSSGNASVTVTLPDNATTWQLDGRAITADTRVGQGTTELLATLPLLMRPVAPRFLVAGDRVQLAGVINNNSGRDQTAKVSLKATGVTLRDPVTQTVFIPAGQRARVTWDADVELNRDAADLVFSVTGQDGLTDSARPLLATGPNGTLPIYRYAAYDNVATAGALLNAGTRIEQINIPGKYAGSTGTVTLRLDSSLAATTVDSLAYLRNFPHDCNEQIISKLLPNLYTLRMLRALKLNKPELEQSLVNEITVGLQKLAAAGDQNKIRWGWFPGQPPDPLVTAYAILAFSEADLLGFTGYLYDISINGVVENMGLPNINAPDWAFNRQAFLLYVRGRFALTSAGQRDRNLADRQRNDLVALFGQRVHLNFAGRAYLLLAAVDNSPALSLIPTLADDLETAAIITPTTAHWEEHLADWQNWTTDTRTTALVLSALITTRPQSALLPNAVRWLMIARQQDHWATTQETVWSLHALTDWMLHTGELQGAYTFSAQINNRLLISDTVAPDSATTRTLVIDVQTLLLDQANRLNIERTSGDGALYYTAGLTLYAPADQVRAISRGVTVTRQYFAANAPSTPIGRAQLGDMITVRLTFTVNQDMDYFVLEDPLPAGMEAVDTSLLTTASDAQAPDLTRLPNGSSRYYDYWGWWYIDHIELRDQQVNLYAHHLPRGTYIFTYQLRASVPGVFKVMPARGYPFYQPGIFGRTDGVLFTVNAPRDTF